MRVLFATAELAPLALVGGLAEASSGLVKALRVDHPEIDLHVVLPDYGDIELADEEHIGLDAPGWAGDIWLRRGTHPVVGAISLVSAPGMAKPHPYIDETGEGWPDNDRRFFAFSAAIAAVAIAETPDVVHLNDWHTAAAVGFMPEHLPTVLTIHTLGYQGITSPWWMERIPVEAWRFAWYGGTNPMAGAVELVDRVIAVSPNYAREIVTPDAGMGLHDRLAALGDRLVGIRNGIDAHVWNPASDPHIAAGFSITDMAGRAACRTQLRTEAGFPSDGAPVVAAVTRLVDQKGIDILLDTARFLGGIGARLAVLGSGSAHLADALRRAADADPERIWFVDGYDTGLAHRLFAGSDLYIMPSRFEPCGLGQMQAMTYGSIPVVTDVGGLHDTVIDADEHRSTGTGFVSPSVDSVGVVDALHRATKALRHKGRREATQRRGMSIDWSWAGPAQRHVDLYREISR